LAGTKQGQNTITGTSDEPAELKEGDRFPGERKSHASNRNVGEHAMNVLGKFTQSTSEGVLF
jgi:hypothetical protein